MPAEEVSEVSGQYPDGRNMKFVKYIVKYCHHRHQLKFADIIILDFSIRHNNSFRVQGECYNETIKMNNSSQKN